MKRINPKGKMFKNLFRKPQSEKPIIAINKYANSYSGDKTYMVVKEISPILIEGEIITYDNHLKTCVHVDKQGKVGEIPYGFVLNHPEIFKLVV